MDNIRINTGEKRVMINDDPDRVIVFSPQDVTFAERFYQLIQDFDAKQAEYKKRADKLDDQKVDAYGIPVNIGDGIALLREVCEFLRERIDLLFGAGASQAAFGDAMTLDMFEQFFDGIMPFIQTARDEKVTRYLNKKVAGRVMKSK